MLDWCESVRAAISEVYGRNLESHASKVRRSSALVEEGSNAIWDSSNVMKD